MGASRNPVWVVTGSEKINQEMENISEKQISQLEIIIFAIDKVKIINEQLEQIKASPCRECKASRHEGEDPVQARSVSSP